MTASPLAWAGKEKASCDLDTIRLELHGPAPFADDFGEALRGELRKQGLELGTTDDEEAASLIVALRVSVTAGAVMSFPRNNDPRQAAQSATARAMAGVMNPPGALAIGFDASLASGDEHLWQLCYRPSMGSSSVAVELNDRARQIAKQLSKSCRKNWPRRDKTMNCGTRD